MATGKRSVGAQSQSKKRKPKRRFGVKRLIAWLFATCILGLVCAMAGYIAVILQGERLYAKNLHKMDMDEAAVVYDVNGNEVTTLFRENREYVSYGDIPEKLIQAFTATEDRRFAEHSGIDFWSIGRALVKDIMAGEAVEGGSTITQQLAKNMFLSSEKTLFRKATEASIALALENHLSKQEIMEKYLNIIYFGNRAYGVKAAAKLYFGKSDLHQLELWEIATLAAIPKAPAYYNPIDHPDRSKERRGVVLQLMKDQGYITEEERAQAAAVDYNYKPPVQKKDYVTFLDYMLEEAVSKSKIPEDELLRGGYKIYTTLYPKAQKTLEQAFANDKLFQKDGPREKMQGAMVIVDYKTGGIVGMIGGRDYKSKDFNRAVKPRQPGSSLKPIIAYAPAMEHKNFGPYSLLEDVKRSFNGYTPSNWDNVYLGQITMMHALQKSANVASVWLLNEIGLDTGMRFAEKLGITFDPKDRNLAIALGGMTTGVSPLQMASAYGAFANNGLLAEPHAVVKILDRNGKEIYRHNSDKPKRVMSAKTAWYMTVMLKNAVDRGTGTAAKMNRPVAGKTGTTQLDIKGLERYNRDVWFVGYTPEWVAAVWMGFDHTDKEHYVTDGGARAAAMFREVMSKALADKPVKQFQKPDGVPDLNEPPQAVGDLTAVYNAERRAVELRWTAVKGDNVAYRLFRKSAEEAEFEKLIESPTNEVVDMTVQPGKSYQYYVVAYTPNTNLEGPKSNIASVDVPLDIGTEPTPPGDGKQKPGDENGDSRGDNGNGKPDRDGKKGNGKPGNDRGPDSDDRPPDDDRSPSERSDPRSPSSPTSPPTGGGTGPGTDTETGQRGGGGNGREQGDDGRSSDSRSKPDVGRTVPDVGTGGVGVFR